jgi:prepilin-type N-terminal cleavage/methylation domain-containing protein
MQKTHSLRSAFTLIELLIVVTIIIVLVGISFPAFQTVQNQARKTQAKNDLTQIITAINAFYTEYGQYPCGPQNGGDTNDYFAKDDTTHSGLFDTLRAYDPNNGNVKQYNPKVITFIQPPIAKDSTSPKGGIGGNGRFYDPWGTAYRIRMDNNYSGAVKNPYTKNAGFDPIQQGAIAWSFGADGKSDADPGPASDKRMGTNADDIMSWQ